MPIELNPGAEQVAEALDSSEVLLNRKHMQLLLDLNNALVSNLELHKLFLAMSGALDRVVRHSYASLSLYDPALNQFRIFALRLEAGLGLLHEEVVFQVEGSPAGEAFLKRRPLLVPNLNVRDYPGEIASTLIAEGIRSACWLPLSRGEKCLGVLCVGHRTANAIDAGDLPFLSRVVNQIAIAVENALAFEEIRRLKDRLAEERNYLQSELTANYNFDEMVGESRQWKRVLDQIEYVAPTDATVLLLGETGTGKELVARAIHNRSSRADRTFVKVNCAAVPSGLLESELFGHEKGAFTGAISRQIGRFELANHGTILLDEIGDIPLELQPKLLRALQEGQFERLGSPRTITVKARVIASTNRKLRDLVVRREFRDDLYYRLNVFPIQLPPLRERRADIPLLVDFLVRKHSRQLRKRIEKIPAAFMDAMMRGDWPGNIRELENVIERAVILTRDGVLALPLPEEEWEGGGADQSTLPLLDAERKHILAALRQTHGVIGGEDGAAVRLGLKRTTLNSRIQRLGLTRIDWESS
jgi:formate hydrogenlyase transcriptional activator